MKLTTIILFLGLSHIAASTYAQNATLNISVKNETVEKVLNEIESQSEFLFFYKNEDLNQNQRITINKQNADIQELLENISSVTGLSYSIKDRHIVLTKRTDLPGITQSSRKITGVILDNHREPVIGANVVVKGTTNGTITNFDGEFSLDVSESDILQITYIGYLAQEIRVANQTTLRITLQEDTQTLDEVVVVGYGTMKKKDLTGAVSSVKMDDTPVGTYSTISHALAGKAAGLQVSTISAQPGGESTFRIRGAASSTTAGNDPLIIIDGFPINDPGSLESGNQYRAGKKDNILATINPNDIESIEVLKDASSTAIYGARAGNGVVIITTKRGKAGAPQVKYSGNVSVQKIAKAYEMLDGAGFMRETDRYMKERWRLDNGIYPYGNNKESDFTGKDAFVPKYGNMAPANDTDWFDYVTRLGFQTQHNVSVNGGTENTKYLISANYFNQEGIVKNNGMERFSARINLDQRLSKYVTAGINFNVSRNQYDNVPLGEGENENAGILVAAAQFNPLIPVKDENGDYPLNSDAMFLPNPASLLEITDKTIRERLLANVFVEVEPIKDLKLKANVGIDRNYQKQKQYLPKSTLYGQKMEGQAGLSQQDQSDYLLELTASYVKEVNNHSFNLLAGHSYQSFNKEGFSAVNNDFLIDGFLYNNLGAGAAAKPTVKSWANKNSIASFFGRVNYSFMDRYLLTATLRADGSSNFAKGNRWGYFPSVALGWRFTEESFMQNYREILSNGKLRVSYGQTGNANVGTKAISYYQVGRSMLIGDKEQKGVYLSQLGNPDLKWETTSEWNIGVDLGFFNNRLNLTAEYYNKVVSDLLNERTLLSYNEVNKIMGNVGKTQSRGFELTVNTRNIETRDLSWHTDVTFSFYRDKWKERDPEWKPNVYDQYNGYMRYYSGYLSDGLIQPGESVPHMKDPLPGQVKIKDIDGYLYDDNGNIVVNEHGQPMKTGKPDGIIDDADKVIYGSKDPGYLFGFNNTIRYKNFDLNFYIYGQFNKLSPGSYKTAWVNHNVTDLRRGYNVPSSVADVWSTDNPGGTIAGYFQSESQYGPGDYYFEKTWFLRMRNITLGYNIPVNPTQKVISNLRVYFDMNNLFTITPYKGLDPETDMTYADNVSQWSYPNVRSFTLGLEITF